MCTQKMRAATDDPELLCSALWEGMRQGRLSPISDDAWRLMEPYPERYDAADVVALVRFLAGATTGFARNPWHPAIEGMVVATDAAEPLSVLADELGELGTKLRVRLVQLHSRFEWAAFEVALQRKPLPDFEKMLLMAGFEGAVPHLLASRCAAAGWFSLDLPMGVPGNRHVLDPLSLFRPDAHNAVLQAQHQPSRSSPDPADQAGSWPLDSRSPESGSPQARPTTPPSPQKQARRLQTTRPRAASSSKTWSPGGRSV